MNRERKKAVSILGVTFMLLYFPLKLISEIYYGIPIFTFLGIVLIVYGLIYLTNSHKKFARGLGYR